MAHLHELIDFTVTGFVVFRGKVLLVLHKQLGLWFAPGGHIELHEDPEEALLREVQEECGLDVLIVGSKPEAMSSRTKPLHTPAFMDIHVIEGVHRHVGMHYFCTSVTDQLKINEAEVRDAQWFSEEDLETLEDLLPETKYYAKEAIRRLRIG